MPFDYWILIPIDIAITAGILCILLYVVWRLKQRNREMEEEHRKLVGKIEKLQKQMKKD